MSILSDKINHIPTKIPPIWCMRQAGRYQSSYRKLREKYSFVDICKTPELASDVAIASIKEFDFDIAILFSDILFPLEALGMKLSYLDSGKPELEKLNDINQINSFNTLSEAISLLSFQTKALEYTREQLSQDKSLLGFIGAPFTLFMFATHQYQKSDKIDLSDYNLDLYEAFSKKIMGLLILSIEQQLNAGAECIVIFDSLINKISFNQFEEIIAPQLNDIFAPFKKKLAYFGKGISGDTFRLNCFTNNNLAGLCLDSDKLLSNFLSFDGFIQGNFNPNNLLLDQNDLIKEIDKFLNNPALATQGSRSNWICSLGHGILPNTPEDNVKIFIERTREYFT